MKGCLNCFKYFSTTVHLVVCGLYKKKGKQGFVCYTATCDGYTCTDGDCLPYSTWVCDGDEDCSGGEDEAGCGDVTS